VKGRTPLALAAALLACAPRATVRRGEPGQFLFLYDGPADAVSLRGSMTGWREVPLAPSGGAFVLTLAVPPGRHELRLEVRRHGASWVVLPSGTERVSDGFGGENAILRAP
jgi:hypothetical protein